MASESFKDYLKINYPNIVFSSVQVQKNCLVIVGKSHIYIVDANGHKPFGWRQMKINRVVNVNKTIAGLLLQLCAVCKKGYMML